MVDRDNVKIVELAEVNAVFTELGPGAF